MSRDQEDRNQWVQMIFCGYRSSQNVMGGGSAAQERSCSSVPARGQWLAVGEKDFTEPGWPHCLVLLLTTFGAVGGGGVWMT